MFPLSSLAGRFALGFGVSALLGWVALRWIGPRGFMDLPEGRKCHKAPVPRTGGIGFILSMLLGLGMAWCALPLTQLQWGALVVMAAVGLADDRYCLRARYKAMVGLSVAIVLAYTGALALIARHQEVHLLGAVLPVSFGLYFFLLLFYFWCVPQSFNLVDGMNGLAMGFAVVVMIALGLSGHSHPYTLGVVVGVLAWNWPRARHFLGDCGSMSLGLLLALLVKKSFAHENPNLILWIFAYPFLDTTMVVVVRLLKGQHPAKADRSHLHHRWYVALGPNREEWAGPILLIQAAACASAVIVQGWGWVLPLGGLSALLLQALWFSIQDLRDFRKAEGKVLGRKPLVVSD